MYIVLKRFVLLNWLPQLATRDIRKTCENAFHQKFEKCEVLSVQIVQVEPGLQSCKPARRCGCENVIRHALRLMQLTLSKLSPCHLSLQRKENHVSTWTLCDCACQILYRKQWEIRIKKTLRCYTCLCTGWTPEATLPNKLLLEALKAVDQKLKHVRPLDTWTR